MGTAKGLIFIIDDEAAICAYMEEIFTGDGYRVISAENGKAALEKLKNLQEIPDLIFLDLMMPVMDGRRFVRELESTAEYARFKKIPIVVMTATQDNLGGQVVEIVRKPPDLDYICQLAEKYAGLGVKS